MPRTLEYFFDYASPYTYLAASQIPGLIERTGCTVEYKPMLLGGLMVETGNSPPGSVPAKGAYMGADIARWLKRYDLPFEFNPHFPVVTIKPLRATLVVLDESGPKEDFFRLKDALFKAVWVDKANPNEVDQLRAIIEGAGLDADHILERCNDPAIKAQLKANTDEAVSRGAFGAPTFYVGDEMFFGNDRLDFVEEALQ